MNNYKCISDLTQKLSDAADEVISCVDAYYNNGNNTPFRALISGLQDEHGFDDCYVPLLVDMIREREPYSFIEFIGDEIFIHHDQELDEEENIIIDPHTDAPLFTERMLNIPGINREMLPDWIEHAFNMAVVDEEGVPQAEVRETSLNLFAETFEKIEQHYSGAAAAIFNYKAGYVAHELYGAAAFISDGGDPAKAYEMASNGEFEGSVEPDENENPGIIME